MDSEDPDTPTAAQGCQSVYASVYFAVEAFLSSSPDLGGKNGRHHPGGMYGAFGRTTLFFTTASHWPGRSTTTPSATKPSRLASATSRHEAAIGKLVVDGGRTAFSPATPQKGTQTSTPNWRCATQNEVLALSLKPERVPHVDRRHDEPAQAGHRTNRRPAQRTVHLLDARGRQASQTPVRPGEQKKSSFNNILKYNTSLADIIGDILRLGAEEMLPVESNSPSAMDVQAGGQQIFNLLQIRRSSTTRGQPPVD